MARSELPMLMTMLSSALVVSLVGAALPPATAPAPSSSSSSSSGACVNLVASELLPCFDYAAEGSHLTKPGKECCTALSSFVKKDQHCICTVLGDASGLAATVGVDISRVMNIPGLCKVDAKFNECKTDVAPHNPMPAEGNAAAPSAGAGGSGGAMAPPPASKASTFRISVGVLVAGLSATAFTML